MDRAIGIAGIAIALIAIIAPMRWPKMPKWVMDCVLSFGMLLIGVAVGMMLPAAQREHPSSLVPITAEQSRPALKISISGGNVFVPGVPQWNRYTGIALDAKIWNTGKPSAATEWTLIVMPKGVTPIHAQLLNIPDELRLGGTEIGIIVHASDDLLTKTEKMEITELPTYGKLLFLIKMDQAKVLEGSTRLLLSVKDIYGMESIATQTVGDWP
jgi:hypothetical protein